MIITEAIGYFKTFTIGTAISTLLLGCIDQIDFESNSATRLLVVDGRITNSNGPHSLKLGITTGLNTTPDKIATPVAGAQITIFNNLGNQEDYFGIEPGIYLLQGNIVKGMPGVEYFIEITLSNGSKYRSTPELMPEEIETTDSVILEFGKEDFVSNAGVLTSRNIIKVLINSQIPATANPVFLRWHVEENYKISPPTSIFSHPPPCYISELPELRRIPFFDGSEFSFGVIDNFLLYTKELDYSFAERHYFNLIRSVINFNTMEYWEKLDKTANRVGSIFDAPPSPVQGNIYNIDDPGMIVLGFFETITTDTTRRFTIPSDIPIFIRSFCRFDPIRCRDCLSIPNSSLERPYYWP